MLVQRESSFAARFPYEASTISAIAMKNIVVTMNDAVSTSANAMLNAFLLNSDLSIVIFIVDVLGFIGSTRGEPICCRDVHDRRTRGCPACDGIRIDP